MSCKLNDLKQNLISTYKFKIELHAHTKPVSSCSDILPEELVKIYSSLGYDGIVITNHFTHGQFGDVSKNEALKRYYDDFLKAEEAGKNEGIRVYFGSEIRFTENINDYLIYGLDMPMLEKIYDYLPLGIEKFRSEIKMDKSLFIQAHPFRKGITVVDETLLDGMETFNMHPHHNSKVGVAVRHAAKNGINITTAGSDCHHVNCDNEGLAALRVKELPENSFELASILKSGDYLFELGDKAIVLP